MHKARNGEIKDRVKIGFNNKKQRDLCKECGCHYTVDRATKRLVGFQIGTRETRIFQTATHKIGCIDEKLYASDHWHAYNLIAPTKHLTGKAHTYTVERINRLLRHYLARFARKNYCYSKSLQMIKYSLLLFMHRELIEHMKI